MSMMERSREEDKPWGLYLALAVVFLLLVWAVTTYLYPIVDNVADREELGIDRVRVMMKQEEEMAAHPQVKAASEVPSATSP